MSILLYLTTLGKIYKIFVEVIYIWKLPLGRASAQAWWLKAEAIVLWTSLPEGPLAYCTLFGPTSGFTNSKSITEIENILITRCD